MAKAAGKTQKRKKPEANSPAVVPMSALDGEHLDVSMLGTWLWDAAYA